MSFTSPYADAMKMGSDRDETDRLRLFMDYDDDKSGRPGFLHGGAIAGLLEMAAYSTLAEALGTEKRGRVKPVNVTVTYMRAGLERRTWARATIERLGKRVANVEAIAWQDDPAKPIAMAQLNLLIDRD